ncbi:hypothetical protein KBC85_00840 [Candidatus Saccharibacteria bacterium]|nr:hypothetical protein [Candidatus Saccharibacteria bacterium]MDQ5885376.1 hypothetical protein [Patescibacteria group bacterium]MDQ5958889.1 hypothetical protein [Patescibacteria group bacterium]
MNVLREIAFSQNTPNRIGEFVGDYEEFVAPRCKVINDAKNHIQQVSEKLKIAETKGLIILPEKGSAQQFDKETAAVLDLVNIYIKEKGPDYADLGKHIDGTSSYIIDYTAHNKDLAA